MPKRALGGKRKTGAKWNKRRRKTNWGAKDHRQLQKLSNIVYKTIETKEGNVDLGDNSDMAHNQYTNLQNTLLYTVQGTGDPMSGYPQRIGDSITVRGLLIKLMLENALGRSSVWYRIIMLRVSRGQVVDRSTIFKSACGNKLMDQINTEKVTVLFQKIYKVTSPNSTALTVNAVGVPATGTPAGTVGNRLVKIWIPGRKFGKRGVITYDNGGTNVKFFDYHLGVVAYDIYGTPQDANVVGKLNDGFIKLYFKDA